MAKKKAAKKSPIVSKRLWAIVNADSSGIVKLGDFYDNVDSTSWYLTKEDAMRNFDTNENEYVVEFDLKSIRTDKVESIDNLIEIKLK